MVNYGVCSSKKVCYAFYRIDLLVNALEQWLHDTRRV